MAHYAFLDENNIVTDVIVGKNENEDGVDWEKWYGDFKGQSCKRTSYNTKQGIYYTPNMNEIDPDQTKAFRKNYAGVGYFYDAALDAFIPPQPYSSWTLDLDKCIWNSPIPHPGDGLFYRWNEATQTWDLRE